LPFFLYPSSLCFLFQALFYTRFIYSPFISFPCLAVH
jgi:hypothetical protein